MPGEKREQSESEIDVFGGLGQLAQDSNDQHLAWRSPYEGIPAQILSLFFFYP